MIEQVDIKEITEDIFQWIVSTLKKKLNLFDYVTEEDFINSLKNDNYIILRSEYALFFCEVIKHNTGLKTITVNVIKYKKGHEGLEHYNKCLSLIEDMAKHLGIDRVLLEGRIGWSKRFPDYNTEKITLFKEL